VLVFAPENGAGTDAVEMIVVAGLGGVFADAAALVFTLVEIGVELDGIESESDTGLTALAQAID
jgi:hypothetical protein